MSIQTRRRPITSKQLVSRVLGLKIDGTSTGVKEVTTVECVADVAASLNDTYFVLHSALDAGLYHVWFNVDEGGIDPEPEDSTGIEVAIAEDDTADTVAAALAAALDAHADFVATALTDTVTITNAADGATTNAADEDTGFTIDVATAGVTSSISIGEGQFDATIAEGGTDAGDYDITFNEPFKRAPNVLATSRTAEVICQISAITVSGCTIRCYAVDGTTPKDADLDVLIIGADSGDAV